MNKVLKTLFTYIVLYSPYSMDLFINVTTWLIIVEAIHAKLGIHEEIIKDMWNNKQGLVSSYIYLLPRDMYTVIPKLLYQFKQTQHE